MATGKALKIVSANMASLEPLDTDAGPYVIGNDTGAVWTLVCEPDDVPTGLLSWAVREVFTRDGDSPYGRIVLDLTYDTADLTESRAYGPKGVRHAHVWAAHVEASLDRSDIVALDPVDYQIL